jgi:hypothetical protein
MNNSFPFIKIVRLPHITYRIYFTPYGDIKNGIHSELEESTIRKAKRLAEWYYKEWLKVNNLKIMWGCADGYEEKGIKRNKGKSGKK